MEIDMMEMGIMEMEIDGDRARTAIGATSAIGVQYSSKRTASNAGLDEGERDMFKSAVSPQPTAYLGRCS